MRYAMAAMAATLLASACAPMPPLQPPPPAVAERPDAAIPVRARAAYAGTRQRVDFFAALYPDCTAMVAPSLHFVARPRHGVVSFATRREPPAFPADNVRSRCNGRRVLGTVVYFAPDRAYAGPDDFALEWITPDGQLRQIRYAMTIR